MDGTQLAAEIMDQISVEVAEAEEQVVELKRYLPELESEKDAAWEEFSPKGKGDAPIDEAASKRYDAAFKRVMTAHDAIKKVTKTIKDLQSPEEFDRRMEKTINERGGIKRMTDEKTPKVAKPTARDQGVPDVYLNEKGNFQIGKDARYKSDLVSSALGIEDSSRLQDFEPKDAEKRLAARDWTSFLDRKREIIAEKERKATERAAEREEAQRVKAQEKEAAKEAKAAEKKKTTAAAAATGGKGQPDPKVK